MTLDPIALLAEIEDIGRDVHRGGYSRHVFEPAELQLREWFVARAGQLGLTLQDDRNSNLWAWWGEAGPDALVTGSHLDSVPGGGPHDGPLGVVSALSAVSELQAMGHKPKRPVGIVVFAEEEGARFGVACLGSRLLTGAVSADHAKALTDSAGVTFADAAAAAGYKDPGPDPMTLANVGTYVELHVEQGVGLAHLDAPVAVASSILEHGRWRITIRGNGDHAGTTRMVDRHDPALVLAEAIFSARQAAVASPDARATIGRVELIPGGANVIASRAVAWLDVRAGSPNQVAQIVNEVTERVRGEAAAQGCTFEITQESYSAQVDFDLRLRDHIVATLGGVPVLATGAGHDAGILAARLPTAMLFVRNPSGISHAPQECGDDEAIRAGVAALTTVLKELS